MLGLNDPTNLLNSLGFGWGGLDLLAPSLGGLQPNAAMNLLNFISTNQNQMLNQTSNQSSSLNYLLHVK